MPGKTQADAQWNAVSKGGTGSGRGHEKRRASGGGHRGRGNRHTKNVSGWGSQQKREEQHGIFERHERGWGVPGSENGDTWGNQGNAWDTPNDTASAWAETPLYTAEDGWYAPEPKIETMEDLLRSLSLHSEDFKKDLIPFFLKSVATAEQDGPEVKLEPFLEEKIQARKASGWYWTGSDSGRKDGDGWSLHKNSDNGWGAGGDSGWGAQNTWDGWGQRNDDVSRDNGQWRAVQRHVAEPSSSHNHQNERHSQRPQNRRHHGHG